MDFAYKNLSRDIDRCLEAYGPDWPRDEEVVDVGKYGKAERIVLDAYFDARAFKALVIYELGMNEVSGFESPRLHRLTKALVQSGERRLVKQLWSEIVTRRRLGYWSAWSYRNKIAGYENQIETARQHVIRGFEFFLEALRELGDQDAANQVESKLESFKTGKIEKLGTKPDPRKMNEELFWQLLEDARSSRVSVSNQIDVLTESLKEFSGPQIKKFQTILFRMMNKTYHWNVWALA